MTVRPQAAPVSPRDDGDSADEAVVWPDPSPLAAWWTKIMQTPGDRRSGAAPV
ncbi:hypothetical protein ACWDSJ_32110 [Nocardia sp. NPDC003482]|uniref:hypothetical protein n=1 Tax=Nocardia sp. NPDC004068 TaxID=3364303 RepID=UPI0036C3953B